MSTFVSTDPLSLTIQKSSQKETSRTSPVLMSDSLLLRRYAATIHYLEENNKSDNLKTPPLYHQKNEINGEGASEEEEDTESEEDEDEDLLSSSSETAAFNEPVVNLKGKTPPLPPAAIDVSNSSYFTPLSHRALPPTIQTYLPQLNFNLYSPSSTPISSIRSSGSSKNNRYYNTNSALRPPSSCFKDTSKTVQNPTNNILSPLKHQKSLYSPSPSFSSTIKMDIRSPPQPSQSTSRFMNAFQRFKTSSLNQHGRNHQNTNNNSVAPAEVIQSMKLSPSKSSLADKIKTKFQQLDKKKRTGLITDNSPLRNNSINVKSKKKSNTTTNSGFSMPRSASISSISNWSSRLTANKSTTSKQGQTRLSHSTSMTSFLTSKNIGGRNSSFIKPTVSISSSLSSSSSSSSLSEVATTPTTVTSSPVKNTPLSLTKSISSHRLYKNNDSSRSSSNSSQSSSSRPRQALRAVNPNESIRLSRQLLEQQKKKSTVKFNKVVCVKETFSKNDYDRGSDPDAVCTRLTPAMAQHIKEELNAYKLHEMQVHEFSRVHTHFFL